jgi:hypothetical protein
MNFYLKRSINNKPSKYIMLKIKLTLFLENYGVKAYEIIV